MGGFCRVARLSLQAQTVKDSIEPEALRAEGEGEGKGGVWVKLSYEAKKKGEKLRCLLLRRKKKIIFFIFMM